MRGKSLSFVTVILPLVVAAAAFAHAWPAPPSAAKPAAAPAAPPALAAVAAPDEDTPDGIVVSGFWNTWHRPLADLIAQAKAQEGAAYRGNLGIVIKKSTHRLIVTVDGRPVKGYFAAFGESTEEGAKETRGDARTPAGHYYIWGKNPESSFHLSFGLSYPNAADAERGLSDGTIGQATHDSIVAAVKSGGKPPMDTAMGGNIMIHGGGIGDVVHQDGKEYVQISDWTKGCIAMRDEDMDELFPVIPVRTPVTIQP